MIVFRNPGEIDIRSVTLMGINAKPENDSPIGYFGTGLKYAIAVLLREGQKIEIWSGPRHYLFRLEDIEFRGKAFKAIIMTHPDNKEERLAFTTEYGKNWTLVDAYRELWSNCKDETGEVLECRDASPWMGIDTASYSALSHNAESNITRINIIGEAFAKVHDTRFGPVLLPEGLKLVGKGGSFEAYAGASNYIYFRGIRVLETKEPTFFTYNFTTKTVTLTEDRTLNGGIYMVKVLVANFVRQNADKDVVESLICCGKQYAESGLDFQHDHAASENFIKGVSGAMKTRPTMVNESATSLMFRLRRTNDDTIDYPIANLSEAEMETLAAALILCKSWGFDYDGKGFKITVTPNLGNGVLGLAIVPDHHVILAQSNLENPDNLLATLIEEWIHLHHRVSDQSRQMQEAMLGEIVRLGHIVAASSIPIEEIPINNTLIPPIEDDEILF